ncbi:hypothetical protein BY458DRAFT_487714 [Sporodiniella umbellata]|nr:hypothetical protein BY458DRAFT_487714 [Sporodiniella umbellata]
MDEDEDLFGEEIWDPQTIAAIDEAASSQAINNDLLSTAGNSHVPMDMSQMSISTAASHDSDYIRLQQLVEQMRIDLEKQKSDGVYKVKESLVILKKTNIVLLQDLELARVKRQLAVLKQNEPVIKVVNNKEESDWPIFPPNPKAQKRPALSHDSQNHHSTPSSYTTSSQAQTASPIGPTRFSSPVAQTRTSPVLQTRTSDSLVALSPVRTESIESNRVNRFLRILLGYTFQEKNLDQQQNQFDFSVSFTSDRIEVLSKRFAEKFVPTGDCKAKELLITIASDLANSIIKCVSIRGAIGQIVYTLGACLSICIKEGLFEILGRVCSFLHLMTGEFIDTPYRLHKDLILGEKSILYKLTQVLDMSCLYDKPHIRAIQENPDISSKSYAEIKSICSQYDITPQKLFEDYNKKRGQPSAFRTVTDILNIFMLVAKDNDDTSLVILIKQNCFIKLLSTETPVSILKQCLLLIQIINIPQRKLELVPLISPLIDLALVSPKHFTIQQVFEKLLLVIDEVVESLEIWTAPELHKEADYMLRFAFSILYIASSRYPVMVREERDKKHSKFEMIILRSGELLDDRYRAYQAFKNLKQMV